MNYTCSDLADSLHLLSNHDEQNDREVIVALTRLLLELRAS